MQKIMKINFDRLLWPVFFSLLCLLYVFCLLHPINLAYEDLGRHIVNGQQILAGNFQVLTQNSYSYTQPKQQFINHHWLSGVIFYLINNIGGIKTLAVFHILILLAALYFFIKSLELISSKKIALLLGLATVLLFSSRVVIRPESFGLLFICHTLWQILTIIKNKQIKTKQISLLVIQQLLWINLHISFIFGIYILSVFTFCVLFFKQLRFSKQSQKKATVCLAAAIGISLLNPFGFKGLLMPLTIFNKYGYTIVENQTLVFLLDWGLKYSEIYFYFMIAFFVGLSLITTFSKSPHFLKILAATGIILGWIALRNLPIFAIFSLPLLAWSIKFYGSKVKTKFKIVDWQKNSFILILMAYLLVFVFIFSGQYSSKFRLNNRKLGLVDNQFASSEFFKKLNIDGNIFNNYDIGGFLIYTLYPQHKVFVDNRPEAYQYEFFKEIYIPMQTENDLWEQLLNQYDFQAIFWGYRDITQWGQAFYHQRLNDPQWKLVYQDDFAVIFVRNLD
jgi:hypothetical protein